MHPDDVKRVRWYGHMGQKNPTNSVKQKSLTLLMVFPSKGHIQSPKYSQIWFPSVCNSFEFLNVRICLTGDV